MGNPTSYLGANLTWQGKQLKSYTTTNGYMTTVLHFAYDENGLRTEKGFLTDKTYYYYNGSVLIGMQRGNVTQRFSYDASGKVVSVNYNGTDYYYLRNAQGDIVKLIDNNKNTVVEYTYDSWGKILATTGSLANTVGTNQPFRYRGYVYDNETGWYYLQSRYYDPTTCRFISSDVYLSTGQGVLGHNSYAYCLNSPITRYDLEGRTSDRVQPEPVGYSSLDEALMVAALKLHEETRKHNLEFAFVIYKDLGDGLYKLGQLISGTHDGVYVGGRIQFIQNHSAYEMAAAIHSHTNCELHVGDKFSREDLSIARQYGINFFLITPEGYLVYCDKNTKKLEGHKYWNSALPVTLYSELNCLIHSGRMIRRGGRHLTLILFVDCLN